MSIWILAILIMIILALTGWRQGAIRAGVTFFGIIIAAFLAVPLGKLFHPLLPHLGVHDPLTVWVLSPICGFILAAIPFIVAAQMVHNRIEHFYKYKAGDLQLALFTRLNTRGGICVGVLNGVVYVILVSFFVFNIGYWTSQATQDPDNRSWTQPLILRVTSNLGDSLQSAGFSRTASGVGTMPPMFYKLADFLGLLMQNGHQVGARLADYPALISLWHRDDMQGLVTDPNLTNALASGSSLGEIRNLPSVQALIANKDLTAVVLAAITNNLDDMTNYLATGKSKYDGEPILGNWNFNAGVTLAWFRQEEPKIGANEMAAVRSLSTQAYGPTTLLLTCDNQIYVKGWPKFEKQSQPQPNQPPFQSQDGHGDWSRDGQQLYTASFLEWRGQIPQRHH